MRSPARSGEAIDERLLSTLASAPPIVDEAGRVDLRFKTGNAYSGSLKGATTMDGAGTYNWTAQSVSYTGDFRSNAITGSGTYTWADGSKYEGQVEGGRRHGVGVFTGKGGSPFYEGEWKDGRRHGQGKLVYSPGGDVYEGQWLDDVREGQARPQLSASPEGRCPTVDYP